MRHQSADDALQPPDDLFNPAVDEERLVGDYGPPAEPAPRNRHHLPDSHPLLDSDIDSSDRYNGGIGEATDLDEREVLPVETAWPLEPNQEQPS